MVTAPRPLDWDGMPELLAPIATLCWPDEEALSPMAMLPAPVAMAL